MRQIRSSILLLLGSAMPAAAQTPPVPAPQNIVPSAPARSTATPSPAGNAGVRQSREQAARTAGIEPLARLNGRIQNRAQSRIPNRINRFYQSQVNTTSPFEVAEEQTRRPTRPRR